VIFFLTALLFITYFICMPKIGPKILHEDVAKQIREIILKGDFTVEQKIDERKSSQCSNHSIRRFPPSAALIASIISIDSSDYLQNCPKALSTPILGLSYPHRRGYVTHLKQSCIVNRPGKRTLQEVWYSVKFKFQGGLYERTFEDNKNSAFLCPG